MSDAVKAMFGHQGVSISGESLVLVEEMFQRQNGTPPFEDDMMLAIIALTCALTAKHKTLKAELQNQCNLGSDLHPIDLT